MLIARIQGDPSLMMSSTTCGMSTCMENVNPCDLDIQSTL